MPTVRLVFVGIHNSFFLDLILDLGTYHLPSFAPGPISTLGQSMMACDVHQQLMDRLRILPPRITGPALDDDPVRGIWLTVHDDLFL